ncbi:hypothetical protein [Streptomyces sp. MZ04]|uniref:DUF7144 family membrane protein n=1 Tax=Streptomyces sp. MZ04 TaxID=2559236 RepID=UPI001FD77869|nr:hypothetical protein [Streptomyces sp. MZ04]
MSSASSNPPSGGGAPRQGAAENAWASGGTMFAGVLMLVNGILGILVGIAAVAKDDVYERIGDYVYKFNLTTWGWIHIVLGILVVLVGYGILKGTSWGKACGVALATVSVLVQFMWLPYQPLWALISIAIGLFVIWALCTDRSDRSDRSDRDDTAAADPKPSEGRGTWGNPGDSAP